MDSKQVEETTSAELIQLGKNMDALAFLSLEAALPGQSVKSTAVVKYSSVQSPASFTRLQCNTDLNLPPSNWMSSSAESYGLQHVIPHRTGFSSFRLAHMFPDCVGQVDVVSDAENIKKLLKIPYSRGPVSMMVHRVENTLLIDEFDIHKHLLRQASSDWEWLRKFVFDHVMQSMTVKGSLFHAKNHSRQALQQNNLMSKFLHHSLAAPNTPPEEASSTPSPSFPVTAVPVPTDPPLPEPRMEEEVPDSDSNNHNFARNVVWTFEDIQMLLGTDMPIFGGGTHPCISLRLCDMARPINVLTGIDYWLDNLMSNVPEVVMCFHLEGIVQRYELIKTEDLPTMEGSKFSPKVIHDIAQSILSFLKANAAKAGHTYWLFKGKDDDFVKLYDLTSLCSESMEDKGQNPFTVPVAMLLYRVARNMKHSPDGHRQRSTIRVLLNNCIELLDRQKYPQIVTSAHYMLSDLYVPASTDPAAPSMDDEAETESEMETEDSDVAETASQSSTDNGLDGDSQTALKVSAVKSLPLRSLQAKVNGKPHVDSESTQYPSYTRPQPLVANVEERCLLALKHVAAGLQCLQFFSQPEDTGKADGSPKKQEEEEAPKLTNPTTPIPMPYAPLHETSKKQGKNAKGPKGNEEKKEKGGKKNRGTVKAEEEASPSANGIKTLLCQSPAGFMPTWQRPDLKDTASWKAHLKILLYEKACLVYATLAEQAYTTERYGRALRMISRVLRCRQVLDCLLKPRVSTALTSYLLGRAGDCCFMVVQNWAHVETHRQELSSSSEVDLEIEHEVSLDVGYGLCSPDLSLVPEKAESLEQMLVVSLRCYERAWQLDPQQMNFPRRIGNVHNELGVLYMNQAAVRYQEIAVELAAKKAKEGQTESTEEKQEDKEGAEEVKEKKESLERKPEASLERKPEASLESSTSKAATETPTKESFELLFATSLKHLEAGVKAFETIADSANLALLHSNTGRLLRLCAHFLSPGVTDSKEIAAQERHYYNKALLSYQKALQVLGNRKSNPHVWDTVTWELSTALFNLAAISQDCPGPAVKSQEEAERNVVDLLQRTLKFCDLETPGPRQPVYQFRAATIHHRLASLYHKSYRNSPNVEDNRHLRAVLQSCKLHYEKATELLAQLEYPPEFLSVQIERIALCEYQVQVATNFNAKVKAVQAALELIVATQPVVSLVASRSTPANAVNPAKAHKKKSQGKAKPAAEGGSGDCQPTKEKDGKAPGTGEEDEEENEEMRQCKEEEKLLQLLEQRLQFILLTATKLWQSKESNKKESEGNAGKFKQLYSSTLRVSGSMGSDPRSASSALAQHLLSIIENIQKTVLAKDR